MSLLLKKYATTHCTSTLSAVKHMYQHSWTLVLGIHMDSWTLILGIYMERRMDDMWDNLTNCNKPILLAIQTERGQVEKCRFVTDGISEVSFRGIRPIYVKL